jgi:hypothetical protein
MAYQDEEVNRRQIDEIEHAKLVLRNSKNRVGIIKNFSSQSLPPYKQEYI